MTEAPRESTVPEEAAPPSAPAARKPYVPPRLVDWGRVDDVTEGVASPPGDDAFTGSIT